MNKPKEDAISVGEGRWIEFLSLDDQGANAYEIDSIISELMPLFDLLETECVVACCGIDAYGFWPDDIERAVEGLRDSQLSQKVSNCIDRIHGVEYHVIVSHKLNNYFVKSVFIQLLEHIRTSVLAFENRLRGI